MTNSVLWFIALCSQVGLILTLRYIVNDIRSIHKRIEKDVTQLKLDAHKAINEAADNRLNLLANSVACKSNWKKGVLRDEEVVLHLKAHDDRIQERDDAIAQRFFDVYEAIKDCKRDDAFMREAMHRDALKTLPLPKKKKDNTTGGKHDKA